MWRFLDREYKGVMIQQLQLIAKLTSSYVELASESSKEDPFGNFWFPGTCQ